MSIKNLSDLTNQISSNINDNTNEDISAQDVREAIQNVADSSFNKIDDASKIGLKDYSTLTVYLAGDSCIHGSAIYKANKQTQGTYKPADWDKLSNITYTPGNGISIDGTNSISLDFSLVATASSVSILQSTFSSATTSGLLSQTDWIKFNSASTSGISKSYVDSQDALNVPFNYNGTNSFNYITTSTDPQINLEAFNSSNTDIAGAVVINGALVGNYTQTTNTNTTFESASSDSIASMTLNVNDPNGGNSITLSSPNGNYNGIDIEASHSMSAQSNGSMTFTNNGTTGTINFNASYHNGITSNKAIAYLGDYGSNFKTRSLIDKGYGDSHYLATTAGVGITYSSTSGSGIGVDNVSHLIAVDYSKVASAQSVAVNTTNITSNTNSITKLQTTFANATTSGLLSQSDWIKFNSATTSGGGAGTVYSSSSGSGITIAGSNITSDTTVLATKSYVQQNFLGTSNNQIVCQVNGTNGSIDNGSNLLLAYSSAKLLKPNGQVLSATNRATLFLMPGIYTLSDGAFTMDTQFVDLVGLGSRDDVRLESTGNTLTQTANDVRIENLTLYCGSTAGCAFTSTDKSAYFPNSALANTVIRNVKFSGTISGTTGGLPMRAGITYSGTYEYCDGSDYCFGFNGVASGTFTNCIGGNGAYGCGSTAGGTCSGTFNYCRTTTSSTYAYGSCDTQTTGTVGGICSGTFNYCTAQDGGFSCGDKGGTASGRFSHCLILRTNFSPTGFASGITTGGTASGIFNWCGGIRLIQGFAGGGTTGGTASGKFNSCTVYNYDSCFGNSITTGGTFSGTISNPNLIALPANGVFRATCTSTAIIRNMDFIVASSSTILTDVIPIAYIK